MPLLLLPLSGELSGGRRLVPRCCCCCRASCVAACCCRAAGLSLLLLPEELRPCRPASCDVVRRAATLPGELSPGAAELLLLLSCELCRRLVLPSCWAASEPRRRLVPPRCCCCCRGSQRCCCCLADPENCCWLAVLAGYGPSWPLPGGHRSERAPVT